MRVERVTRTSMQEGAECYIKDYKKPAVVCSKLDTVLTRSAMLGWGRVCL